MGLRNNSSEPYTREPTRPYSQMTRDSEVFPSKGCLTNSVTVTRGPGEYSDRLLGRRPRHLANPVARSRASCDQHGQLQRLLGIQARIDFGFVGARATGLR